MRINITARMLKLGQRNNCRECPVALGMIQAGCKSPTVGLSGLFWSMGRKAYGCRTPKKVARFIRLFDSGSRAAKPFSFELDGVE